MSRPPHIELADTIGRKIHKAGETLLPGDPDSGYLLMVIGKVLIDSAAEVEAKTDKDAV